MRRIWYQYYTQVSHSTCDDCLAWHGEIRKRKEEFPDRNDGCERHILCVPPRKRRECREMRLRMRAAARSEVVRRKLFEAGMEMLADSPERALASFHQAAGIEVYLADIERLAGRHRDVLNRNPTLRDELRSLFLKAFSDKYGRPRYERLPETMRLRHERAGAERIAELLR